VTGHRRLRRVYPPAHSWFLVEKIVARQFREITLSAKPVIRQLARGMMLDQWLGLFSPIEDGVAAFSFLEKPTICLAPLLHLEFAQSLSREWVRFWFGTTCQSSARGEAKEDGYQHLS
jgi:hypothetical protein